VWVSACSTGEEAYTVGIVLTELLEKLDKEINFKNLRYRYRAQSVEARQRRILLRKIARPIKYRASSTFFSRKADGFLINREIRENVVFAPHNF